MSDTVLPDTQPPDTLLIDAVRSRLRAGQAT